MSTHSKRIAVVTGASSGIGREFVFEADKLDNIDEIWVIARRLDRLEELGEKCTHRVRPIPMDLSKEESLDEFRELLAAECPQVGFLVNAAGFGVFGPFAGSDISKQLDSLRVNMIALVAICHACLRYMKRGDVIINIGSNSSWQPVPWQSVYGAGKSGVLSFSRAIGRELKKRGIHVMCVCPGWIKTEFQDVAAHDEYIKYVDRWYGPEEVAKQAMEDLAKGKTVSILGSPVRRQVMLVKHLPVDLIMNIWCRQQGIE
ncbi:MAG: SDR family NAD(P)-dependent oxidoreductase [Firmicutes bacterium]|nr:SDR family NAD(P)-dependent oxidoreductase [Bacillota bacterium]